MALAYSYDFTTTPPNLVTDIKNAILASTDWSAIGGTTYPGLLKATTAGGAALIVEIGSSRLTTDTVKLGVTCWQAHTGASGGGTNPNDHYLGFRYPGDGANTSSICHVTVSASADHLCLRVEGPRSGETGANSANGQYAETLVVAALAPYFAGDTTPVVVACGPSTNWPNMTGNNAFAPYAYVSTGIKGAPWAPAEAHRLTSQATSTMTRDAALDSHNQYLSPWVIAERDGGLRGSLKNCYFGGYVQPSKVGDDCLGMGEKVSYGGQNYVALPIFKGSDRNSNYNADHPFGAANIFTTDTNAMRQSPVILVPCA